MASDPANADKTDLKTRLVHMQRADTEAPRRAVNPPIIRASTVLYRDVDTLLETRKLADTGERVFRYGARGTPTTFQLEAALTEIEGGAGTLLFPTGLAAVAHPFLSLLRPGDHVLLGETVYGPARAIAEQYLRPRQIDCEFYAGGHDTIAQRLRPETRMVYIDNPGSIIFDIQDVPAIARLLEGRETYLVVDNTWGAPGLYRPILLGADISVIAITKYIAGHSDVMMGSVTATHRCLAQLRNDSDLLGQTVSPDDAYMALRGLRTAAARLAMHAEHARVVAEWLASQDRVAQVLYPPREGDPGHALWQRDFTGANGLMAVAFRPEIEQHHVNACVNALSLFGLGASWGGFESLAMVYGSVPGWQDGRILRLHIGLEDPKDLIEDLARGFAAMDR